MGESKCHYYAHLTDEEIEAQRGLSQGHTSSWEHGVSGAAEPGCRPFEESLALLTTLPEPEYGESSLGLELGSLGSRALGHLV